MEGRRGFALTYLPFIARAFCDVVHDYPNVNASVDGETLVVHRDVNLGIAVDLDFKGLIAPVIRNADGKRLRLLAREVRDLATRAEVEAARPRRDRRAARSRSRTWVRSAPRRRSPIINQPQVAIMATDGIRKGPVVVEGPDGDDAIVVHHVGLLALTWDHRAFDGAYAASFLERDAHRARDARLGSRARVTVLHAPLARARFRTREADDVAARAARARSDDDYLLLLEHPHVYTLGSSAKLEHVLRDPGVGRRRARATPIAAATSPTTVPASSSATRSSRCAEWRAGQRDVVAYVRALEDVADRGARRLRDHARPAPTGYTGVWVGDEKIAAIGVRVSRVGPVTASR